MSAAPGAAPRTLGRGAAGLTAVAAALAIVTVALSPAAAHAQGGTPGMPRNPRDFINNPHPTMPWVGITNPNRIDYGTVIRSIAVPAQSTVIEVLAPTPEGVPRQMERQVVEIPGYQVVETTTGFYYPARWTLDQVNVGVYAWRRLEPEFRPKP
jgi:hypothetical protein